MRNNLHLTLSNIIKDQSNEIISLVLEAQSFTISNLSSTTSFYICSKNIIHHSLVDFLPAREFKNTSEITSYKKEHQTLIINIIQAIEKLKNEIKDKQIIIKSAYIGGKSIALEAYLSSDILNFAYEIKKNIKSIGDFPKVKGFPSEKPKKFAINIIRFLRPLSTQEDQILNERVLELTKKLQEKPIEFELKRLSLVVSDDYLSNPDPEITKFVLNKDS
ncbi:hypothetical protein A2V71_00320 [Candidatus Berkelbacteria bacterium RBG_13_40_8]|uniref:Uncharacterized protein n=1 Tax=Candidatus Berkelbacteria bacterium RBG_13_40_8 TaxID=1797467 RepID=A0A1F5DPH3_9BACT|nr:MAG: hypothetical protein A2V71_00320 [Candidatus Berkelbacteria bacterium RBG_13_40_8]